VRFSFGKNDHMPVRSFRDANAFYRMMRNPEATVSIDGDTWQAAARLATPRERDEIWAKAVELYPGWTKYEARAGERPIEAFVLSRR
jgi:deazaflavin-dependent oxidoreductase (nitroreductase family)